ncbi:restriction endonuclease subunit S [Neisseriaceae bacterium TC5R-5]|nr:restriction endonuclease subunit S [Neisseriaceae bacterium TC5R-5]
MDAQLFLAEFGHIANAPGGIGKLRKLILQLAIQGRLIAAKKDDTSSRALLNDVRTIKANLVASKKLPREKHFSEILKREITADTPQHWEWVRFGEVWQLLSGRDLEPNQYNDSKFGVPYITGASNLEDGAINVNRWTAKPVVISHRGDLLITCKGTIGKTAFNTLGEIHIARQIMAVRNFSERLNSGFLKIWLDGFVSQLVEKSKSMIPGFSRDDLVLAVFPVPPLKEQSRIVAKVDELMALCDKLETQQQARRKLQNKLRQSTLQAVASATSPHELQASWTRLADNFGQLFHAPGDVTDLRQAILDLAFTGNISEQSERVTSNLVGSLHLRKIQLSEEKRIKRETPVIDFPGIAEMLGSIPDQWAWVRLNDIASVVRGGSPRPAGDPKFYGGSIPFLKVADVTAAKGMFIEHFTSTITEAGLNKTREISKRTVLLTNSGATLGVPAICEFRTTFNDGIAAFIELNDAVLDEYLYLFLKSKTKWLQDIASRGQGQPNLNTEIIRSMWFPFAPINEQYRIVTRVSELMRFCDVLEASLKHVAVIGERLATTAVSNLTGITVKQDEEPMKAPHTELIAPLRLGTAPDIKAQAPLATILARHNGEMSAKDLWQRFGGEIDAFYAQLKTEVAHGWVLEPAPAEMREKPADTVSA